jgi:hypothetical protein
MLFVGVSKVRRDEYLKHGVFCTLTDLQAAINRFVAEHNQHPKPFVCRKDPAEIIAAVNRGYQTLESIH